MSAPSITIQCECGERYHAGAADVGRRLRCRKCGAMLDVAPPSSSARASEQPASGEPKTRTRRRRRRSTTSAGREGRQPLLMPRSWTSRIVGWLVWTYLAAVSLIAITMWTLGDVTVVGTILLFMGRWVFLLPLLLLVPGALVMDRRMLAPLALATLVVLGPIMGARTGWRRLLPAAEGTRVRVVTFNAESGRLLVQRLPEMVVDWKADVLAFQECGEDFASILARVPAWHHYAGNSLCVLTRFPIREAAVMDRSALDEVKQAANNLVGGAGYVVRLTLDGPTGPLRVTNLHLETPRKGLEGLMAGDLRRLRSNTTIRGIESRLARRWADSGSGPSIVLGDFNTPVESRIFQRHWGDLDDAFSVAGTGLGMTKHNGWIRARIDHVLVGPEWRVDRVTMGDQMGSDHRPLIVDLTLRGRRRGAAQPEAGNTRVKVAP